MLCPCRMQIAQHSDKVKLFQARDERVQALRRDISRAEGRVKELTDEVKKLTEERDNALRRFGLCV